MTQPFYKTSHPRLPPTIPSGKLSREPRRPQILPFRFRQHEEHGHEQTPKKHKHSHNTWNLFSSHLPLGTTRKKNTLSYNWKFLINSNLHLAASDDLRYKQSSITLKINVPLHMTSLQGKSYRNCLPQL
jgi:hypothetical protein